ncbi:hypothetical protein [Legionella drancourtii]|uniref:Uncharacterized protein n=1 Tax=Legionella drancourtii LLAP12 TaxID=658187 RepID=G9ERS9_9GAMM|nr:hypothetical protein [Legionella drancourtii]EHL29997.1 hypothetical protein LDG_7997 [Legionella drancourtii LLAP12]
MTRALKIMEEYSNEDEKDYFLRSDRYNNGRYVLSYKLALCYAIHKVIQNLNDGNDIILKEKISQLIKNLNDNNAVHEEYYSFLPLRDEEGAYIYVDHQKGCFPLVIYNRTLSEAEKSNISINRKYALIKSLEAMQDKADQLYQLLKDNEIWNDDLQEKIIELCPDPKVEDSL